MVDSWAIACSPCWNGPSFLDDDDDDDDDDDLLMALLLLLVLLGPVATRAAGRSKQVLRILQNLDGSKPFSLATLNTMGIRTGGSSGVRA